MNYKDWTVYIFDFVNIIEFVKRMEEGRDYLSTPNMAFNNNGNIVLNKVFISFSYYVAIFRIKLHHIAYSVCLFTGDEGRT